MDRLGLDAARLRADRPELIHVSISGYGPDGRYRDKKAHDALIQAEAGLIEASGSPDQPARVRRRHLRRDVRLRGRAERSLPARRHR